MSSSKKEAWFLLIILSVIWGSSFILIKRGLISFSPLQIACIRVISAALVLLIPAIKNLKHLSKKSTIFIVISGVIGSFIPSILFAQAQTRLPSAITGVLNSLTPMFVAIIASVWFKYALKSRVKLGFVLALIGSIILSYQNDLSMQGSMYPFILLVVIACVCYATNLNLVKYKLKEIPSMAISSLSLLIILIPATILLLNTDFVTIIQTDEQFSRSLMFIIVLGLSSTGLALVLFNRLLKVSSPTFSSSIAYIIPMMSVLFGVMDGETILFNQITGISILFVSTLLINV